MVKYSNSSTESTQQKSKSIWIPLEGGVKSHPNFYTWTTCQKYIKGIWTQHKHSQGFPREFRRKTNQQTNTVTKSTVLVSYFTKIKIFNNSFCLTLAGKKSVGFCFLVLLGDSLAFTQQNAWTSTPDPGIRKHTPRLACLISAVWTLGCRYWFRVVHWDVVAGSVLEM